MQEWGRNLNCIVLISSYTFFIYIYQLRVKARVSMVELTRLRRQFQKMTAGSVLPSTQAIADSFAEYLISTL